MQQLLMDYLKAQKELIYILYWYAYEVKYVYGLVTPEMFSVNEARSIFEKIITLHKAEGYVIGSLLKLTDREEKYFKTLDSEFIVPEVIMPIELVMKSLIESYYNFTLQEKLSSGATKADLNRLHVEISKTLKRLQRIENMHDILQGIGTSESKKVRIGFPVLDKYTGGLGRGETWVVGGAPGAGKSYFANQIALNVIRAGGHVLIISLENSPQRVLERMLSNMTNIHINDLNNKALESDKLSEKFNQAKLELDNYLDNLEIRSNIFDPEQVVFEIQKLKQKNLDLVIVDFVQNFRMQVSEYHTMTNAGNILQNAAQEFDVCMMIISQLNYDAIKSGNKSTAFKGSGVFSQIADQAIILHEDHEKPYDEISHTKHIVLDLVKTREGRVGQIEFNFRFPGGIVSEAI